ncbi:gliding motility-associated C-terminal domain-containing protein [Leptobacterium sp. I13]|uniref:T9SS type B sorting domain-containing protein n=1 Tax=Leptobacterium meishanense TaxID=3128904 RepID=UPI0030EC840D
MNTVHYSPFNRILCLLLLIILNVFLVDAQSLKKPVLNFSAPCASENFNTFSVEFNWDPPLVNTDNIFIIELSGPNGSFTNSKQLATATDKNTVFAFDFNFSFPENTYGSAYKIRVRSTSPSKISPESDAFPAYYQNIDQYLVINELVDNIALCEGASYVLSIDNFPNETRYRWFKNRNIYPIPNETGPTLEVTEEGYYYVEVDYGEFCSSNTSSNEVGVFFSEIPPITINEPSEIIICEGGSKTLETNIDDPDLKYAWYKNNVRLEGLPSYQPTLIINTEGVYHVVIENEAGCSTASETVSVLINNINASIENAVDALLLPGEITELHISTNAQEPSFSWYKDGVILDDEQNSSLLINEPGAYKVKVRQNDGCLLEAFSEEVIIGFPEKISMVIARDNSYASCESEQVGLFVSSIRAHTSENNTVDVTGRLMTKCDYQWFKDNQNIVGETSSSLTVPGASKNGDYLVKASLYSFEIVSNALSIKLKPEETLTISSDNTVLCSGSNTIEITSSLEGADYKYTWYKDNLKLSETTNVLTTNLTGTYIASVEINGCTVFSNELIITPFNTDLVKINAPKNIVIIEGSQKNVIASGADIYTWFNEQGIELSNTTSVTLSEEGNYVLKAYIDDCEVIKHFSVSFQESFVIPNIISPNADGINDLWIIPDKYAFKNDVEVFIYGPNGESVYRTMGYQNNWPQSSLSYPANKPVFYYKILLGKKILKQGSITLIQ